MAEGDCAEQGQNQNGNINLQEAVECMKIDVDKEAIQQYYFSTSYYANGGQAQQEGQNNDNGMDKLYVGPCKCPLNITLILELMPFCRAYLLP
jgi:hypothetical protein